MDSTMIGQECIDELADFAGIKDKVAAITERAMQGELDFEVDRRIVMLEEPLKMLGLAKVAVRLHSQVEVEIEVQVERAEE